MCIRDRLMPDWLAVSTAGTCLLYTSFVESDKGRYTKEITRILAMVRLVMTELVKI